MSDAADRVVETREGAGEPIMLKLYGPKGEVAAVPLSMTRALTLAQELLTRGAQAIKVDWPGYPCASKESGLASISDRAIGFPRQRLKH